MKAMIAYALGILIVLGLIAWLALSTLDRMVTGAENAARAERDAYWQAEIAKSNADAEKRLREQAMAAQAADTAARDRIDALNLKITEMDKANEALPVNACGGLGRDRVKLLDLGHR